MDLIYIQGLFNSVLIVSIVVRHAEHLSSPPGRFQLMALLVAALLVNAMLNSDRFDLVEAALRGAATSLVTAVGIFGLAAYNRRRRAKGVHKEERALRVTADTPSTPTDRGL